MYPFQASALGSLMEKNTSTLVAAMHHKSRRRWCSG